MKKEQIQEVLTTTYSKQHRDKWKQLILDTFGPEQVRFTLNPEPLFTHTKAQEYHIEEMFALGTVRLDDHRQMELFEVHTRNTTIGNNRVGLNNLVKSEIVSGLVDAALVVFYADDQPQWRLSFLSKYEFDENTRIPVPHKHPKKFTYVLGPTESCKTATDQWYSLASPETSKTLEQLIEAFSVGKLSDEFFKKYRDHYEAFYDYLKDSKFRKSVFNIPKLKDSKANKEAEKPLRDFVKKTLGRIVFLYFLQKKGWLGVPLKSKGWTGGDLKFMTHLLQNSNKKKDFYTHYLAPLFFGTLNEDEKSRPNFAFEVEGMATCKVPYLNGGLFEKEFEQADQIEFPRRLFEDFFYELDTYNFTIVEDSPEEREVAVDPEMLGHIFENLIEDNKDKGTFYTPKEVVHFMVKEALYLYLKKALKLSEEQPTELASLLAFVQNKDIDAFIKQKAGAIDSSLDVVRVCDPAIGSGAFPMGMLLEIYQMKAYLYPEKLRLGDTTPFNPAEVKEQIILNSIYGVDIDKGAIDIARLRFWLSLIVDLKDPRPLPNLDYKFMQGDSLKEEFGGITFQIEHTGKKKVDVYERDLFGKPTKTQTTIFDMLTTAKGETIEIEDLEHRLFHTHNHAEKEAIRQELFEAERQFVQASIDQSLKEVDEKIERFETKLKKDMQGLPGSQALQLEKRREKERDKLQKEKQHITATGQALQQMNAYEKPYFLWHLYFKDAFDAGGFDIVIANPPYGVKMEGDMHTAWGLGSKDSYGFFMLMAQNKLLKPGGACVQIVSDTWLTITSHWQLRNQLLRKRLHKVIRLHANTFNAVVNSCIYSQTNEPALVPTWWDHYFEVEALQTKLDKIKNPKKEEKARVKQAWDAFEEMTQNWQPGGYQLIAADLTQLHPHKQTPEFREKLYHLEQYVGEATAAYAVYQYPQNLLFTNSNLPVFTASPALFALMNDMTCPVDYRNPEGMEEEVEIRQIDMNGKQVELVRFGDVAEVRKGIDTGDNQSFLFQESLAEGSYRVLEREEKLVDDDILYKISLNKNLKEMLCKKGFDTEKQSELFFDGKFIVPYEKGGASDIDNGWMPNYYVPHQYYIDWSSESVERLYKNTKNTSNKATLRNRSYWFEKGLTFSLTGYYAPSFRLMSPAMFDNKSSGIFSDRNEFDLIAKLSARLSKYLMKNFIMHTVDTQVGAVVELPSYFENNEELIGKVKHLVQKQKANPRYNYLENEQKEIDALVYELYGLNEADIQEVETWWARRYPKLARYADMKPQLDMRQAQEQARRLMEVISQGENKWVEFKSTLRLNMHTKLPDDRMEHSVLKTIAAFLNSDGGTLIVGVDDDGKVVGFEETDYTTFKKADKNADKRDEWLKHFDNLIKTALGDGVHQHLTVQLVTLPQGTVAAIEIKGPGKGPNWLTKKGTAEEFYIRRTASTIQLTPREAAEYIKELWG